MHINGCIIQNSICNSASTNLIATDKTNPVAILCSQTITTCCNLTVQVSRCTPVCCHFSICNPIRMFSPGLPSFHGCTFIDERSVGTTDATTMQEPGELDLTTESAIRAQKKATISEYSLFHLCATAEATFLSSSYLVSRPLDQTCHPPNTGAERNPDIVRGKHVDACSSLTSRTYPKP